MLSEQDSSSECLYLMAGVCDNDKHVIFFLGFTFSLPSDRLQSSAATTFSRVGKLVAEQTNIHGRRFALLPTNKKHEQKAEKGSQGGFVSSLHSIIPCSSNSVPWSVEIVLVFALQRCFISFFFC